MKKRLLSIFCLTMIIVLAMFSMSACKKNKNKNNYDDEDDEKEHVCSWYDDEIIEKTTCDTDGRKISKCKCGKTVYEITPATGHSYGEWQVTKAPTCTDYGTEQRKCSKCKNTEKRSLDKLDHDYTVTDQTSGSVNNKNYRCKSCSESFTISTDLAEQYENAPDRLFNCPTDFSFYVTCSSDELYVRNHLKIFDAFYEGTEYQSMEGANVEYTLTKQNANTWKVTPLNGYVPGETYKASRSGSVIFRDYGIKDLTFSIFMEETMIAEINDDIIYLQKLENKSAGYYPYDLEYSENSDTYWLTLYKTTGLSVGDIICVGPAKNYNDVLKSSKNTFGKIVSIDYVNEEGYYLLALETPMLNEVFDELDIYVNSMVDSSAGVSSLSFADDVTNALLTDEDFIDFAGASYATALEYIGEHHLATPISSFKDFLNSIEVDKDRSIIPNIDGGELVGKIVIVGEFHIPLTLGVDDGTSVGSISISFEAVVSLDYLRPDIRITDEDSTKLFNIDLSKLKIGLEQSVTLSFKFNVDISVDYSMESKPYIYNSNSDTYHYAECKSADAMKWKNKLYLTTEDMLTRYVEQGVYFQNRECKSCKPVTALITDGFVVNQESKVFHIPGCSAVRTLSDKYTLSSTPYGNLILMGYKGCGTCKPESRQANTFSDKLLDKIKNRDFGSSTEEIKAVCDEIKSNQSDKEITIGKYPFVFGPVQVNLELAIYVDFTLEASLEYKYELNLYLAYGIHNTANGIKGYLVNEETVNDNILTVFGEARFDVGAHAIAKVTVVGMEKALYGSLNAKFGLYAEVHGALQLDFEHENNSFAAAYFETGVHFDVYGEIKIPLFIRKPKQLTILDKDIPILTLGYGKIVYDFDDLPQQITIVSSSYSLDRNGILTTKAYNLVDMKATTFNLNPLGVSDSYTIRYTLASGANCEIRDGVIYIKDTNTTFTDQLTITVTGLDDWDDFNAQSIYITLPTVTVDIIFNGLVEDHTHSYENGVCTICGELEPRGSEGLEYELNSDEHSYCVIGIGTCEDEDIVIPSTYNGLPVTTIGWAFPSNLQIVSVVIPDSVTYINSEAFAYCDNLTSVTIGNGVTSMGDRAFGGCEKLSNLTLGNNLTSIPNAAFHSSAITGVNIPESVTSIGNSAFSGCHNLVAVNVGSNVTSIGSSAFAYCSNLQLIIIPNSVTSIGARAFLECTNLTSITLPNSLTSIEDNTFEYCTSLKSITIPSTVKTIGYCSFSQCTSLASVTIPDNVTKIGRFSFAYCENLATVTIGNSVQLIDAYAFTGCSSLTSISIPDSVEIIAGEAFSNCENITTVVIGKGVTNISAYAFWKNLSLQTIKYRGTQTEWDAIRKGTCWASSDFTQDLEFTMIYNYTGT